MHRVCLPRSHVIISFSSHDNPGGVCITTRKLRLREESHAATATHPKAWNWTEGSLGLALCAPQGPVREPELASVRPSVQHWPCPPPTPGDPELVSSVWVSCPHPTSSILWIFLEARLRNWISSLKFLWSLKCLQHVSRGSNLLLMI